MRLLCIQNGLLQQHCTNQGRRRLVACSVAFRVLGAENDHVSCRLPARRCWIRHDTARCCWVQERASWQRIVERGGGGRPLCKAACGRRPRSESHPHCGRSAFRASKHGLASAYPGGAGQQQQDSRTAERHSTLSLSLLHGHDRAKERGGLPGQDAGG